MVTTTAVHEQTVDIRGGGEQQNMVTKHLGVATWDNISRNCTIDKILTLLPI